MSRLLGYLRRYRLRYLGGAACLLATASLAMAVPYLLKRAVDAIAAGGPPSSVGATALLIVAIALVQAVVRTLSRALIFNVGRDVENDLRNDLFAHLMGLDQAYYQRQQTGDLMSRLINDVTAVRLLLGPGMLNLVNTPIYYAYGLAIMLSLSPSLTLVALLPFPFLLLAVKRISRQLMERTLRVQQGLADLSSAIQENVSGIAVVKAYAAEDVALRRFAELNETFTRQNLDLARVRGRLMPLMKLASGTGTLAALLYGGSLVAAGALTLGGLVAFIGYLNILAWPTMALGWMLSILQRGRAALRRLEQIFAVRPQIASPPEAAPLPEVRGRIELRDVSFAYDRSANGAPTLEGISFVLEPGRKLAVVGRTGAGKTALIELLPRLFDVRSGSILLDGRDIRTLPLEQLRGAIGFVPQAPYLFSRTIRDNIAFALDTADDGAIARAIDVAGLAADLEQLPRGLDTMVGERGITLSGGQKQRLALARAIAAPRPILVLDDALSSVDTRTEAHILGRLRELMRGRTSIVVAHRISTILDADHIAVLDEGRVVEFGDHASLLARNGLYADLFRRQQLEEEIERI